MQSYLAIHTIPAGTDEPTFRRVLENVAAMAGSLGVDVKETVFSLERGQAYSLCEAGSEADVREVARRAGLPAADVFPASLVYTELLREPQRAR